MKKLLALLLAAALAVGSVTVALADNRVVDLDLSADIYLYNEKEEKMESLSVGYEPVPSGSVLYIPVDTMVDTDDGLKYRNTVNTANMKDFRIKLREEGGRNYLTSAKWTVIEDSSYRKSMYVAVATSRNSTGREMMVDFTLTVVPKNGATVDGVDDEVEYEYTVVISPQSRGSSSSSGGSSWNTVDSSGEAPDSPSYVSGGEGLIEKQELEKLFRSTASGGTAVLLIENDAYVSAADVKAVAAAYPNRALCVVHRVEGKTIYQYRITAGQLPLLADQNKDGYLELGMTMAKESVTEKFSIFYDNILYVASHNNLGLMGVDGEYAISMKDAGLNYENIKVYLYDAEANTYQLLNITPTVDQYDYLYMTAPVGLDLIFSQGVLQSK